MKTQKLKVSLNEIKRMKELAGIALLNESVNEVKQIIKEENNRSIVIGGKSVKTYTQNGDKSYNVTFDDGTKKLIYVNNDGWDEINQLHRDAIGDDAYRKYFIKKESNKLKQISKEKSKKNLKEQSKGDYSVQDFLNQLKQGPYSFPGGYPVYFITKDGGVLSFDSANEMKKEIVDAIKDGYEDQWVVVGADINWEDNSLYCDHSGEKIESAY
jgi:hypothetical protein